MSSPHFGAFKHGCQEGGFPTYHSPSLSISSPALQMLFFNRNFGTKPLFRGWISDGRLLAGGSWCQRMAPGPTAVDYTPLVSCESC